MHTIKLEQFIEVYPPEHLHEDAQVGRVTEVDHASGECAIRTRHNETIRFNMYEAADIDIIG